MSTMIFKDKWLLTARTLTHENACGLFLEAVLSYGLFKRYPDGLKNLEAMGAFKAIKDEIDEQFRERDAYLFKDEDFMYPKDKYMTSKEIKEKYGISLDEQEK